MIAVVLIAILFTYDYYFKQPPKRHIHDWRPEGERWKAPVPHIDPGIINVTNSKPGDPTTVTFEWYCDYSSDNTMHNSRDISFQLLTLDAGGNPINGQIRDYDRSNSFDHKDGRVVYYKATESTTSGYKPGTYTLHLTSFISNLGPDNKASVFSDGTLNISACDPKCNGNNCGKGQIDCGSDNDCGSCTGNDICDGGTCQCVPFCAEFTCDVDDGCGGQCQCADGESCIDGVCYGEVSSTADFYNQKNCGDTFNTGTECPYVEYDSGVRYIAIDWYIDNTITPDSMELKMSTASNQDSIPMDRDIIQYQNTPFPDQTGNINNQGSGLVYYRYMWNPFPTAANGEMVTTELFVRKTGYEPVYANGEIFVKPCACTGGQCDDSCGYPNICVDCTGGSKCYNGACCTPDCTGVPQGGVDGCGGNCGTLGCWYDAYGTRTLPGTDGSALISKSGTGQPSLDTCKQAAIDGGFKYFGLQDYNEYTGGGTSGSNWGQCWAGNDIGTEGTRQVPGSQGYKMYGRGENLNYEPTWAGGFGCYTKSVHGVPTYVGTGWVNAVYSVDD